MNRNLSADGRWRWNGRRWVPIRRGSNWALVIVVIAATSPLWIVPLILLLVFVWSNLMAGWNGA